MSIAQLARHIGNTAYLRIEGFQVAVTIRDVKQAYGNTRYLVNPTSGTGEAWVDESRLSRIGEVIQ